jgi:hypothetical protein
MDDVALKQAGADWVADNCDDLSVLAREAELTLSLTNL